MYFVLCLTLTLLIPSTSLETFFFLVIYQDNPSDKDINQGTLVVFNLDPSVSNDDLCQIFGAYGEVKEVLILHNLFLYCHFDMYSALADYIFGCEKCRSGKHRTSDKIGRAHV